MQLIPLYDSELEHLSPEDHDTLYLCSMAESTATQKDDDSVNAWLSKLPKEFDVLFSLLDEAGVKCTPQLLMFIVRYCKDSRELPMWAFTLYCVKHIDRYDTITLMHLVQRRFVKGFPKRSELRRIWNLQRKRRALNKPLNGMKHIKYWPHAVEKLRNKL